jgi:hypothetical protein
LLLLFLSLKIKLTIQGGILSNSTPTMEFSLPFTMEIILPLRFCPT